MWHCPGFPLPGKHCPVTDQYSPIWPQLRNQFPMQAFPLPLRQEIILLHNCRLWIFFGWFWCLNSGLQTCKASTLPLEPLHQPFCVGCFWDRVPRTICPGLALNFHSPDLCLLSSQDYRLEQQALSFLEDTALCQVVLNTGKASNYLIRLLLFDYFVNVNIPLLG
jgi:hypothetical protein